MTKLKQDDVLKYCESGASQSTVKRHYLEWRAQQNPPIPFRCDLQTCYYFDNPLEWSGEPLVPILDHENGVHNDNRPQNLRFLCPNCNSQQSTHGGGNKGKVSLSSGGFGVKDNQGKKHYTATGGKWVMFNGNENA
jgi:hypothetical protein